MLYEDFIDILNGKIIGITKFVEYTNRKEAYNRAVKIAQGNNEN